MLGECHAHIIMDGVNYRRAVELHKEAVQEPVIRRCLEAYAGKGVSFIRDGGDSLGVSRRAKELAPEYGLDYRTPVFAIHKNGHYGSIVGHGFDTMKEYWQLVKKAENEGADFIKIMTTGIMDFSDHGKVTGEALNREEVREMVHIAHEEGFAVMSHTNGASAVRDAASCGVDSVEHGNYMDQDTLELLAESRTVWVPTMVTVKNLLGSGRFQDSVIQEILDQVSRNVQMAYKKGVLLAAGSDAGAYRVYHGQGILDELSLFYELLGDTREVRQSLEQGLEEIKKRFRRQ